MKSLLGVAGLLSLAVSDVAGHYIFQQFTVTTTKFPVYQYIRKNSNYNSPVTDLASKDLRCNVGADGKVTDTLPLKAGDPFTFTTDTAVYHNGPVSLYMSRAPGYAADYAGDGEWFKINDWGPTFSNGQPTWPNRQTYTFNIPKCIRNGEYLLRIQSLGIHNPWPAGLPQFYISCAQLNVSAGGNVNPSPTVLIPGAFKDTDPGYTANIYNGMTSYKVPGPDVFKCPS